VSNDQKIVVLATKQLMQVVGLEKGFVSKGFSVRHVRSLKELTALVVDPRVAYVFIDYGFSSDCISLLRSLTQQTLAYWIMCLEKDVSESVQLRIKELGVRFIVKRPKQEEEYLAVFDVVRGLLDKVSAKSLDELKQELAYVPSARRRTDDVYSWEEVLSPSQFLCPTPSESYPARHSNWERLAEAHLMSPSDNREALIQGTELVLKELCDKAFVSNFALMSVRPEAPNSLSKNYSRLLVSSEGNTFSARVPLSRLPDLRFALQEDQNLFLDGVEMLTFSGKIDVSKMTRSVLTIPVHDAKGVAGMLRGQFSQKLSVESVNYARDVCAFSKSLQKVFSKLEFYARIYAPDSTLYK